MAVTDICNKCEQTFPIDYLVKNSSRKRGYNRICKPCAVIQSSASYFKNHDKTRERRNLARNKNRVESNKKQNARYRDGGKGWFLKKFGITLEEYKTMVKDQSNLCKLCGLPERIKDRDLAVDHCHETGKIRGLLCFDCNTALGKFKDDIDLLKKAINYIKGESS